MPNKSKSGRLKDRLESPFSKRFFTKLRRVIKDVMERYGYLVTFSDRTQLLHCGAYSISQIDRAGRETWFYYSYIHKSVQYPDIPERHTTTLVDMFMDYEDESHSSLSPQLILHLMDQSGSATRQFNTQHPEWKTDIYKYVDSYVTLQLNPL